MSRTRARPGAKSKRIQELLRALIPGHSFLIKYQGDEVWQEHFSVFPITAQKWVVLTPDLDKKEIDFADELKVEDVADYDDDGKPAAHALRRTRYEFTVDDYPSGKDLAKMFKDGFRHAAGEVQESQLVRPPEVFDGEGNVVAADSLFGGQAPWKPKGGWADDGDDVVRAEGVMPVEDEDEEEKAAQEAAKRG